MKHNAHIIRIGSSNKSGVNSSPVRGLIKFTLPELNAGDQVIYATLNLCSYQDDDTWAPPSRKIQINVHRMTSDWEELTAKWSELNSAYNSRIEDYEIYQYDSSNPNKFYTFNVTGMVKEWYTTGNNYGLMLKEDYENYECGESDAYFISSYTSGSYEEGRPLITIAYRNQTGLEDYLSYHTQSVGRAGTIYTNDYNGNLVLTHYDVSTPGSKLPVTINHVFNTNDKDTNIGYGKGYRLNLSQTISFQTIDGTEYGKYIDEDGTAHYFPKDGESYKDEDGSGLTLYKNGSTCTISDKSGNKNTFTKDANGKEIWYLTNILDTEGNNINITIAYNSSGNPIITKVVDGANQSINLTYSGENLETITDLNGRVTKYLYTDSNLTQVQYSDGKSSYYTYDSANKLINAKNIDGISISYEYYTEKTSRVKKIQEYSTENEAGNSLQIRYGDNSTIFTDESGYSNTIVFNNYGNATSIADFGKENSVDGAFGKTYSYGESGGSKNKLTLESKMISIRKMSNNLITNPYFDDGLNNWTKNVTSTDGTTQWIDIPANMDSSSWQFVSKQFITNFDYSKIDIYLMCYKNANNTYFDNIGLFKEDFGQSYTYDSDGNIISTQDKAKQNSEFAYNITGSLLSSVNPKGGSYVYEYNFKNKNRLMKAINASGIEYSFEYDDNGNISTVKDNVNANTETYTYDLADRLVKTEDTNGFQKEYSYDNNSNVNKTIYTLGTDSNETEYNYDRDNRINSIVTENDTIIINYDRLSRIVNKEIKSDDKTYVTEYEYLDTNIENKTTEKVKSIKNGNNELISYTYDANGNIETIQEGNEQTQRYYYDGLNQLIREDNKTLNKTIVYTYDAGGNIVTKKEYSYTTGTISEETLINTINYTYGNTNWRDQSTSFNGKAITYDEIGNLTSYDGATYTWQNGRELASITKNGTTIQYKYNDSGIRTSKIINGTETKYHLEGSKVVYETTGNIKIYYTYDENGDIIGMTYSGNKYYYVKNLQNDIIGILNSDLEQIVKYEYDSWGNIISITDNNGNAITDTTNIGLINPYRYRSYRYDSEIQMYYLNSRYYNPEWGRFINADGLVSTDQGLLGHNMYAYCNNNPVNMQDESGTVGIELGSLILGLVAVVLILYTCTIVETITDTSGGDIIQDIVDTLPSISLSSKTTTTLFSYDEFIKSSNNKGFLLQTI